MARHILTVALLGGMFCAAAPARADDCTRLFSGQSPRDDEGWQYALWDFATFAERGKIKPELITMAASRLDAAINAFDPIKPGNLGEVAGVIADAEAGTLGVQLCDATLTGNGQQPRIPASQVTVWRTKIKANAEQFVSIFGEAWEEDVMSPGLGRFIRPQIFGSSALRAAIAAKRPALWPRIQAAVMATREGSALQAQYDVRANYEKSRVVREIASASLPAVANGWRKTGTRSYSRTSGPVTATLFCSTGFGGGGGLSLQLDLRGGDFVSRNRLQGVQSTAVHMRINGRDRSFIGRLASTGSEEGTSFRGGEEVKLHTTYYNTSTVVVSINSPKMLAQQMRNANQLAVGLSGQMTRTLFGTEIPDDENALKMLMDMYSEFAGKALESNPLWNVDINEVRQLATLPVSVDSDSFGRLQLFDLAPAKAPFKNLMDACWG